MRRPASSTGCPNCTGATIPLPGFWKADYSSFPEATLYLESLDDDVDGAEGNYLEIIGLGFVPGMFLELGDPATFAYDWAHLLASGVMTVARVTENAGAPDVDNPAILLVCGVHAHEWIPQETCLGYVDWLVKAANGFGYAATDQAYAQDLLGRREIWVVAMADPAGRLWDEGLIGTGEPFSTNDWRKNRQQEQGFACTASWGGAQWSGSCTGIESWMEGDEDTSDEWRLPGVNVGSSFSHGWSRHESTTFRRDMIFDDPGEHGLAPETYQCQTPADCISNGFDIHSNCLTYLVGGNPVSGCFVGPAYVTEPACLIDLHLFWRSVIRGS